MKLTMDIDLKIERCSECGRYYGIEMTRSSTCPYCARRNLANAMHELEVAERSARALRGTLTRRKKART